MIDQTNKSKRIKIKASFYENQVDLNKASAAKRMGIFKKIRKGVEKVV